MLISVVNRAKSISDETLQCAIRAINRQIAEDFEPYWSFGAKLRLEGAIGATPNKQKLEEMRGDAVLYLWDQTDVDDALGYHEANFCGIPYGFIFTELCKQLKEEWSVTLSHEALELLGDAQGNLLVQGPHPTDPQREVFHWFEMCDAVQSEIYAIDGVKVSNFVLPLYFTPEEQAGGRNDFLGRLHKGKPLHSFGVNPGGYIGYYDPVSNQHETYFAKNDQHAQSRLRLKRAAKFGRGYLRQHGTATIAKEPAHQQALEQVRAAATSTEAAADPIRHVVVLMLENRSFDHLLGDMIKVNPQIDGLPQNGKQRSNTASSTGHTYAQQAIAKSRLAFDLDHEHDSVMEQLGSAATPMTGFVDSFLRHDPQAKDPDDINQVMAYFPVGDTPAQDSLPVLHGLARQFLVCDKWFSSMPGPTWPNRFFVHSGTCLGHVLMPSREHPEYMRVYSQETLYDRLGDQGKPWKIYHDGMPQSIVLTRLLPRFITSSYGSMDDFEQEAKGAANDFPAYAFIEPAYFGANENDQHPPSDIGGGEQLIARVYNALRSNAELWQSTLLIVVYDEHGGFYDHVAPPATIAPDDQTSEYDFRRLGVRVPAILVSPWVDPGVCHTVFDHTSILRYMCDKYGLPPLGSRTAPEAGALQANSFASELSKRTTPRTDTPAQLRAATAPRGARVVKTPAPVEGSREALMLYVAGLAEPGPAPKGMRARAAPAGKKKRLGDTELKTRADAAYAQLLKKKALHKRATSKH